LPAVQEVTFDEEAGIVVRDGRFAALTRQEQTILSALLAASPRARSKEQILRELYLHDQDEAEIKIVDVFVCKLRKKLKPLGLKIETLWGRGYRFIPIKAEGRP